MIPDASSFFNSASAMHSLSGTRRRTLANTGRFPPVSMTCSTPCVRVGVSVLYSKVIMHTSSSEHGLQYIKILDYIIFILINYRLCGRQQTESYVGVDSGDGFDDVHHLGEILRGRTRLPAPKSRM